MSESTGLEPTFKLEPDDSRESSYFFDNPRAGGLSWGPTPLAPRGEGITEQADIERTLDSYYDVNVPPYISDTLKEFIHTVSKMRAAHRTLKNKDSFGLRDKIDFEDVSLEQLSMYGNLLSGDTSPAEALEVMKIWGLSSVELGSLQHFYGNRMVELDEMRPAILGAAGIHNLDIVDNPEPIFEVLRGDDIHTTDELGNRSNLKNILMKRDTLVAKGTMVNPRLGTFDVSINERFSFVVPLTEENGFDEITQNKIAQNAYNRNWARRVMAQGHLDTYAEKFIALDDYRKVIPVSTTTIAYSHSLFEKLHSQEHMTQRLKTSMARAAVGKDIHRDIPDYGDIRMITFGVKDSVVESINAS